MFVCGGASLIGAIVTTPFSTTTYSLQGAQQTLLLTKLYIPAALPNLVARPRLTAHLGRLLERGRKLALIAAPAGFGKTTLLSEWIRQHHVRVAWVSLDESDNDPILFFSYLCRALDSLHAGAGATALSLLRSPQPPALPSVLTLFINELSALEQEFTLVLDDYHAIHTQAIHTLITFLLDHLPPAMRIILTSRIDPPLPLAQLRARGQMIELFADDLRFSPQEAASFLNQVMGLSLIPDQVAVLETRTEGWVAGLQLAALAMQGRADIEGFVRAFAGSHRFVLDYLVEQVLARQSEDVQRFLLQTSVLDRFNASLCDAVTGRNDSAVLLPQLAANHLFVIALDDERQWFRYHHLFADMLRHRLQHSCGALVPGLHGRASEWCEQNNFLAEAMQHALAAQDLELAASYVERHATKLLINSELMLLRNWMAHLPGELIRSRPRLALAQGWVLTMIGHLAAAEETLNTPVLQAPDLEADLAGELAVLHADITNLRHEAVALTWARQALELLPPQREDLRVIAMIEIGLAYLRRNDLVTASQALQEVATRAAAGENHFVAVDAFAALHQIKVRQGQLIQAVQTCEQALRMVARWAAAPPATGMIYVGLGEILCEWNDLDGATKALAQGLRLLQGTIEKMPLVRGHVAQARVRQAQGDHAGALASLAQAEAWFAELQITDPLPLARLYAQQARLWIRQGDLDAARRWAGESSPLAETELACEYWLTIVRLHLAQHRRTPDSTLLSQASAALVAAHTRAQADDWPVYLLKARALQALTLHMQNNLHGAFAALSDVLALAEPGGYVRIFLDEGEPMQLLILDFRFWIAKQSPGEEQAHLSTYADKLLAAFPQAEKAQGSARSPVTLSPLHPGGALWAPSLVEPLSSRELEVLQLIADGLSNAEIAARLVVTLGTVKTHVNHIFGKLDVTSRTQAIGRARGLGLLVD
jgi:LuxR family maltose regulon positive regulatory protein